MATDEEKTVVEGGGQAAAEAAPKKGPNKLVLFGGIGVGVIAVGVVLALFVLKPMMSGSSDGHEAEVEQVDHKSHDGDSHDSDDGGHGEASQSMVYAIKDIVVNPAGTGGTRFLSVSFGFELGSSRLASEFRDREPLVRDALITILSSKTVAQLTDARQKEIVRYQIKKRLEQLLDTKAIDGVYYTDFVLQ